MSTIQELKKRAADEYEWANKRATTYREDGQPLPDPIRRVLELSAIVNACEMGGGVPCASLDFADVKKERDDLHAELLATHKALRARATMQPSVMADRLMRAVSSVDSLLDEARNALDGVWGDADSASDDAATISPEHRFADRLPLTAPAHPPIPLRHGLVLVHLETRRRVLFSEPHQGRFMLHTITDEGLGPATDTSDVGNGMWHTGAWEEASAIAAEPLPKWDAPKKDVAPVIAIEQPIPAKPRVKDWNPSADDMAKYAVGLKTAMDTAGVVVAIDVPSLIMRFKAERGEAEAPKPGVSFHHWAAKTLKG